MAREVYYRFFSFPAEIAQWQQHRMIRSTNPWRGGETWFTTTRYDDPIQAQALLALHSTPTRRVGPTQEDGMPEFDVCGPRRVEPAYGFPGGGLEVCTTKAIFFFGCYNFVAGDWED
jgi:hypothetical protein